MPFSIFRRARVDVTLSIDGEPFLPGGVIRGSVNLNSDRNVEVREGAVSLECVERYWKNEYDPGTKSTRPKEKSRKLVHLSERLLDDATVRSGVPMNEEFEFAIPEDAYRSVNGEVVRIRWEVKVSLDVPGARDVHVTEEIIVSPPAESVEPQPLMIETSFGDCGARIEAEDDRFRLGDAVSGRMRVDAVEDCEYSEVRFELVREERAGDKKWEKTVQRLDLESDARFRSGLSREWRFEVAVPTEMVPSVAISDSKVRWLLRGILARSRRRDHTVEAEITVV